MPHDSLAAELAAEAEREQFLRVISEHHTGDVAEANRIYEALRAAGWLVVPRSEPPHE